MQPRDRCANSILGVFLIFGLMSTAPSFQAHAQIAFTSFRDGNEEIYVMDADGSNLRNLTRNPALDSRPAWSPDGGQIAFTSDRDGNWEIYVMDANGRNLRNLTKNASTDDTPSWSPNGEHLAFTSSRDGPKKWSYNIYVMGADGSNSRNLTRNPWVNGSPTWSPDGRRIAFDSDRDGNLEIYVMDADGGNPQRLTRHLAFDFGPSWSPNGEHIALNSSRGGNNEIYVMDTEGGNLRNLTNNNDAYDASPSWSPDGKKIAFASANKVAKAKDRFIFDIFVMDINGGNLQQLTKDPESEIAFASANKVAKAKDRFIFDILKVYSNGGSLHIKSPGGATGSSNSITQESLCQLFFKQILRQLQQPKRKTADHAGSGGRKMQLQHRQRYIRPVWILILGLTLFMAGAQAHAQIAFTSFRDGNGQTGLARLFRFLPQAGNR